MINKWDLIEKETNTMKEYKEMIREKTAPFVDYPIIFTSALTKQRVLKAIEEVLEIDVPVDSRLLYRQPGSARFSRQPGDYHQEGSGPNAEGHHHDVSVYLLYEDRTLCTTRPYVIALPTK